MPSKKAAAAGVAPSKANTPRWADHLAGVAADNFEVKIYLTRCKGKITFYGLAANAQLACCKWEHTICNAIAPPAR